MYTVIEKTSTIVVDGVSQLRVTILVDTADDLPDPPVNWVPGSMALIASGHGFKILNNEREWV